MTHREVRLALRERLLELEVCSTGGIVLSVVVTGRVSSYVREEGSFLDEGFARGMEVLASNFNTEGNNGLAVVTRVTATHLSVNRTLTAELVVAPMYNIPWGGPFLWNGLETNKTLVVGLPSRREWENVENTPVIGYPYVSEEYVPGPQKKITHGPHGTVEFLPLFMPKIHVPSGTGVGASDAYTSALLALFAPSQVVAATADSALRVQGEVAPLSGQLLPSKPGFSTVPVKVPLWLRTPNSI